MSVATENMLVMVGDTYRHREKLKAAGWKWNAAKKQWYQQLTADQAAKVRAGDKEYRENVLKVNFKGCKTLLDMVVIFESKTYVSPFARADRGGHDLYNCDAHGNLMLRNRITGSAPDDCI